MTKEEQYAALLPQVKALCEGEDDIIAKMANVSALLHHEFGFWWTGFYRVTELLSDRVTEHPSHLVTLPLGHSATLTLGPFHGPIACVHIAYGRGVCGTAWKERRTVVVPDVEEFPGHIACSSESRSEIVVPVFRNNEIIAVLDIDSRELATFDDIDAQYLEEIVKNIP
jgi:GAF domain-containing protein